MSLPSKFEVVIFKNTKVIHILVMRPYFKDFLETYLALRIPVYIKYGSKRVKESF